MVEAFIFTAYVAGTAFGYFWGKEKGRLQGIEATIDNLIEKGYLKATGSKSNPNIVHPDSDK